MPELRIAGAPLKERLMAEAARQAAGLRRAPSVALLGIDFGDLRSEINLRIHTRCFEGVGIDVREVLLADHADVENELLALIGRANDDEDVDAVMVLLPLPPGVDVRRVISSIHHGKEVEGLHVEGIMRNHPLAPPTTQPAMPPIVPEATLALLRELRLDMSDVHVVIVNSPRMVAGNPVSRAITGNGSVGTASPGAVVSVVPHTNPQARTISRMADLVLVSVDEPRVVDGGWCKPGALVIDYNAMVDPAPDAHGVVGGVDTESAMAAGASVAPIPGGFGPVLLGCVAARIVRMSAQRQSAQGR